MGVIKIKYIVKIYPEPFDYIVEARDKNEAEYIAMTKYNNRDYTTINNIVVKKIQSKKENDFS